MARIPYIDGHPPRLPPSLWTTTTLYRLYAGDGRLLYVGVTRRPDLRERFNAHRRAKSWWSEVTSLDIETFPAEHLALDAERHSIRTERPAHNIRSAAA